VDPLETLYQILMKNDDNWRVPDRSTQNIRWSLQAEKAELQQLAQAKVEAERETGKCKEMILTMQQQVTKLKKKVGELEKSAAESKEKT